jgi:hypothetical protein
MEGHLGGCWGFSCAIVPALDSVISGAFGK